MGVFVASILAPSKPGVPVSKGDSVSGGDLAVNEVSVLAQSRPGVSGSEGDLAMTGVPLGLSFWQRCGSGSCLG